MKLNNLSQRVATQRLVIAEDITSHRDAGTKEGDDVYWNIGVIATWSQIYRMAVWWKMGPWKRGCQQKLRYRGDTANAGDTA